MVRLAVRRVPLLDGQGGCACRKSDSCVTMMQPTDHGLGNDAAMTLDGAADRFVLEPESLQMIDTAEGALV